MVFPSGVHGRVDLNAHGARSLIHLRHHPISAPPSPPPCPSLPLAPCCGNPASPCAAPPCAMPPPPRRPQRKRPLKPPPRPLRVLPARVRPAALLSPRPPSSAAPLCSAWPPPAAAPPRLPASSSVSAPCVVQPQRANWHVPFGRLVSDDTMQRSPGHWRFRWCSRCLQLACPSAVLQARPKPRLLPHACVNPTDMRSPQLSSPRPSTTRASRLSWARLSSTPAR